MLGTSVLRASLDDATVAFFATFVPFRKVPGQVIVDAGAMAYSSSSAFYAASGFMPVAAVAIVFIVGEREKGVKHQQIIAGICLLAQ
jgi:D-serine deaminase-like pyridoxal phosphate-dependent protein